MKKTKNILWGLALIIIGIIIGLKSLGIANIDIFFDGWWTLFIIVPCFIDLFTDEEKTGNIIGILIGVALLLSCQNIIDFDIVWKLFFPTILIIIGLSFIFKDTFGKKVNEKIKEIEKDSPNKNECVATFSEQNVKLDDEKFEGVDINAIFGSVKYDLTRSIIEKDSVINATSIFGGTEIYIPQNVKVKIKSTSIFGSAKDERKSTKTEEGTATIYINSTCLFGGVTIK